MEDSRIIALYWKRSEHAISETAAKYGRFLNAVSNNILHDEADAEECVNDTYLRAWNSIPPQRPGVLKALLGCIVRNLSLDRYKKRAAVKRRPDNMAMLLSELGECIPSREDTQQDVEERAAAQAIDAFLKLQAQDSQILFVRRYWYCDTIKSLAGRFHCSESKIKSSLWRLRNELRQFLQKEGVMW